MAPTPRVRLNKPLEPGQTTILSTLNGHISIQRPPPPPRPGLAPKSNGHSQTVLGRRLVRGLNEKQVAQLFTTVRLEQNEDGEPRDLDLVNNTSVGEDLDDLDGDYIPTKQYSYSREHKLAAIEYF
jgi:hypothetical protein